MGGANSVAPLPPEMWNTGRRPPGINNPAQHRPVLDPKNTSASDRCWSSAVFLGGVVITCLPSV
jgi:hypothetical protein